MSRNKRILLGVTVAALSLFAGIYAGQQTAKPSAPPTKAWANAGVDKLLALTLLDSEGKSQAFSQWRGKTLVVNFWAAWCPPCREEMPAFSRLQDKYAANGVQFTGIALDSTEAVRAFSSQHPVTYPLLMGGAEGTELARQLGNSQLALPYTVIFSPSGETRFARLGAISEQELDTFLRQSILR